MTVLKLSPVEFRPEQNDISVLFLIEFKRPNGKEARLYVAINGWADIPEAIDYLQRKFQPTAIEYQPNLFHTWEWEGELEKLLQYQKLTQADD